MRKYQAIWEQIKQTGSCKISAQPALHARLRKAVKKEKYNDTAFKVEWDLKSDIQPELHITIAPDNKNVMIFKLIKPITLGEL